MKAPFEYNVRAFTHSSQGGRKYMEDMMTVAYMGKRSDYDDTELDGDKPADDLEYVYVGIFDGHGGKEAAVYTRDNLLQNIVSQREFWSDDDQHILKAIKQGFIATHYKMLKEVVKWPRTSSGLLSTAGTTASVCFIMNNKYYTGHVGDSKIVLGKKNRETGMWIPYPLTTDHKPESPAERQRIYDAGGEVMNKSGVERVVWFRPKSGHKGPIRRSTSFDRIPFLAVARSLGDLWSYNPENQIYVVSPEPDVEVIPIDADEDKCLVLASDGLWNVLLEHECIRLIQEMEEPDEVDRDLLNLLYCPNRMGFSDPTNPSQALVSFALQRWFSGRLRADNTSVVTLLLDHRGPTTKLMEQVEKFEQLTDEQLRLLACPVVLPQSAYPAEYFISPDRHPVPKLDDEMSAMFDDVNVNVENIPLPQSAAHWSHTNRTSATPFDNAQNKFKVESCDNDKYSLLSPAMQSLCELARRDNNFNPDSTATPAERSTPNTERTASGCNDAASKWHNSNELQMYVNELPEESFRALSDALKLRNGNRMHKVINGVPVFRDYDETRPSFDDESSCETNSIAKKFRDECVSVTEELVDGATNGFDAFREIAEIAKTWTTRNVEDCESTNEGRDVDNVDAPTAMHKSSNLLIEQQYSTCHDSSHDRACTDDNLKEMGFFKRHVSAVTNPRKRKLSGSNILSSPVAKHTRSSRWSRGKLASIVGIPKRWQQLTASLMTTTRLRAKKDK